MQIVNEQDRRRVILAASLLAVMVVLVAILGFAGMLAPLHERMWEIFRGREELRSYIESWGAWAPVVFVLIQALQVVIAPIPGELTGAVYDEDWTSLVVVSIVCLVSIAFLFLMNGRIELWLHRKREEAI